MLVGVHDDHDDTQGKNKHQMSSSKYALVWTCFLVAACLGFCLSQFGYVYFEQHSELWTSALPRVGLSQSCRDAIPLWTGPPRSELEKILRIVAPQTGAGPPEVLIGVCTYNLVKEGTLTMFLDTLLQSGVTNYLIVALDKEVRDHLEAKGMNVYYHKVANLEVFNHAVSSKKFRIIQMFLELGWNVFLADIDIVILRNPFDFLYRDHDVEAMTDGFDDGTAFGMSYGLDDKAMGWARYAQGTQHLNLNSGCFYLLANDRTLKLVKGTAQVLENEKGHWDQAILNNQLFFLSHGAAINPGCTVRVMEREKFMNSKVLFKEFRYRPHAEMLGENKPVMIHMNYHPNKVERMKGAIDFFLKGDSTALARFPGGSEPGS